MVSQCALNIGLGLTLCLFAASLVARGEEWMAADTLVHCERDSPEQAEAGAGCARGPVAAARGVHRDTLSAR
jgi:hypothetical protein